MAPDQQPTDWLAGGVRDERLPWARLDLDLDAVARGLGCRRSPAAPDPAAVKDPPGRSALPPHLAEAVDRQLDRARELAEPRWVWRPVPVTFDADRQSLLCAAPYACRLAVGAFIRNQLRGSRAVAAFVVTIGPRLEAEARRMMADGQGLDGFVLDTIGSAAVEATADLLEEELALAVDPLGWRITNRLSPGYCSWETRDQHALFGLLPEGPAGVTLTDSALMQPIKSVSGVIGLGENVEHQPYPCDFCSMTDCRQRLTEARF